MPDDAAVWKLDDERALIFTADFFTPIVDDPYDYGAIAAANALSDVYAMGGEPFLALNLAALPVELPEQMIAQILLGSAEKAREAGCIIAGGHTVDDDEPKFGLAVLGYVHPQQVRTKATARPGDLILLTKPLGVGLIATVGKAGEARPEHMAVAVEWMKRLNKGAATVLRAISPHAVTDITGFALLGHAWEVASRSQVRLRFDFDRLPFHPGALDYAEALLFPAGANNNMADYGEHVTFAPRLEYEMQLLCFCPETSGGLLITCAPDQAEDFLARYGALGQQAWIIGQVLEGEPAIEVT
jgi:selenide,water dikinase